jgi:hypothetical protein
MMCAKKIMLVIQEEQTVHTIGANIQGNDNSIPEAMEVIELCILILFVL